MTTDVTRSLVAELERGGELVDHGVFSIDANQALAKLRDHQLSDPHAWILLAIEAGVLAGAERVEVSGEGELVIELGLVELHPDELEQLYAWVFAEIDGSLDARERGRRRALQQLALACNTALGRQPDALILESYDGEGRGARLTLTPARPLGELERDVVGPPGARMHAKGLAGARERELVRERCGPTTHDIRLGHERVSRGPGALIVGHELEAAREQLGFTPSPRTRPFVDARGQTIGRWGNAYQVDAYPSLAIVCNGVMVERIDLRSPLLGPLDHELDGNFVAVVERDLPRDLSQSHVRHGPELAELVGLARAQAKPALARQHQAQLVVARWSGTRMVVQGLAGALTLVSLLAVIAGFELGLLGLAVGAIAFFVASREPGGQGTG